MMNESNCEGQRLGFLKLFERYDYVEIPLIQRDYAQGRESAKAVRERFLDSLLAILKDDKQPLSLDFIYGEVMEEVEGKPSCFQPIDGQQRLTTLFLLHWYLACVAEQRKDFAQRMRFRENEPRFKYSVRKSSDQFFARLLDYNPDLRQPLKGQIENQAWFFRAWQHDSTIHGALVMLEAIRERFAVDEAKEFYGKLQSSKCPITFDVLNLGSLGLSDEIYIKMNARGKELTGFEKFKAWLIGTHCETNEFRWSADGDEAKPWPILLDGDWLDLFWAFQDVADPTAQKPSETVLIVYFRTVLALVLNFHASKDSLQEKWMTADNDDQRSLWPDIFTTEALQSVFRNLEKLSSLKKEGLIKLRNNLREKGIPFLEDSKDSLCNAFFEGSSEPGFKERLWLHALCLFLEAPKTLQDDVSRDDWFRVIRNLIGNSNFEQKNFANAVKSISELAAKCQAETKSAKNRPVLNALLDSEFLGLQVFDGEQKKEESDKARLMLLDGSNWEGMILEAERHPVFLGQIGFLLDGTPQLDDFQKRWAAFNQLLGDELSKLGKGMYLLARAALSQCEHIQLGYQQNLEFKNSAGHWKYLLGSNALGLPKGKFRKGVLKLIDGLKDCDPKGYQSEMEVLSQKESTDGDWMDDVIRFGHILLQWGPDKWISRENKVQNYGNNGTFIYFQKNSSDSDIMLGKQAYQRNSIIKLLLESDIGLSIDKSRKVSDIGDANPPFYKGHKFHLEQESLPWRVSIQYHQIVLQQKITANSQSGETEKWDNVPDCSFEFSKTAPEVIIKSIKEKIKPSPPETDMQL